MAKLNSKSFLYNFSKGLIAANVNVPDMKTPIDVSNHDERMDDESEDLGVGIDGNIVIIDSAIEPKESLSHSIISATETVVGLLRVDQLIPARGD